MPAFIRSSATNGATPAAKEASVERCATSMSRAQPHAYTTAIVATSAIIARGVRHAQARSVPKHKHANRGRGDEPQDEAARGARDARDAAHAAREHRGAEGAHEHVGHGARHGLARGVRALAHQLVARLDGAAVRAGEPGRHRDAQHVGATLQQAPELAVERGGTRPPSPAPCRRAAARRTRRSRPRTSRRGARRPPGSAWGRCRSPARPPPRAGSRWAGACAWSAPPRAAPRTRPGRPAPQGTRPRPWQSSP